MSKKPQLYQSSVKQSVKSVKLGSGLVERARSVLGGRGRQAERDIEVISQGRAPKKR